MLLALNKVLFLLFGTGLIHDFFTFEREGEVCFVLLVFSHSHCISDSQVGRFQKACLIVFVVSRQFKIQRLCASSTATNMSSAERPRISGKPQRLSVSPVSQSTMLRASAPGASKLSKPLRTPVKTNPVAKQVRWFNGSAHACTLNLQPFFFPRKKSPDRQ